jgi:hypothetical protein
LFHVAAQAGPLFSRPAAAAIASVPAPPARFKKVLRKLFMVNDSSLLCCVEFFRSLQGCGSSASEY